MGKYNRIGFACIFLLSSMLSGCKGVEEEPVTITVIHAWETVRKLLRDDIQNSNVEL